MTDLIDRFARAAEIHKKLLRGELTYEQHQQAMMELLKE